MYYRTIDAISFQVAALNSQKAHTDHQKWFLDCIFEEHRKLINGGLQTTPDQDRNALMLTVEYIEVGDKSLALLNQVDTSFYRVPRNLLTQTSIVESLASSPILPLLRVLGVASALRVLSALICENRVLMISSNPTRLAQCSRSILSILTQGLLNWHHLYIPVLPPHLFQFLAAPVPYLIGMLSTFMPKLNQMASDDLGEMVIINLDNNEIETRGMNPMDAAQKVPDLFQKAISEQGMSAATMSASEMLAQDLVDLLKMDKRVIYGESTLTNVSETAAKATKAVKSGITTLARKGKKFFNKSKANGISLEEDTSELVSANDTEETMQNSINPDMIYVQGSHNEIAEEEARIAFSSFFLSLIGNMRWYLSASPGQLPHLDKKRFLHQKQAMGEGENTAIWPLLQNFCQTQMLEQFAKARVEEVRLRSPVTADSSLFTQCANYHRLNNIDFSVVNVRRVARQLAHHNPSRIIVQTSIRRTAMLLTSNKTYEGDYNQAVAQLVEQCRECTSVLFDVMTVIWVRMRDSKGVHWKHGLQALQVLRNLLYHGPLAVIAEATDGLEKIRKMKFYNDSMRSQICTQIRQVAHQVYNLLVDRAKLFNIRRICVNKRRLLKQPEQTGVSFCTYTLYLILFLRLIRRSIEMRRSLFTHPSFYSCFLQYKRDTRFTLLHPFRNIHRLVNPQLSVRVAPTQPIQQSQPHTEGDIFGLTTCNQTTSTKATPVNSSSVTQDMLDIFTNVSVSDKPPTFTSPKTVNPTPVDPFSPSPTQKSHSLTPPRQLTPPRAAQQFHASAPLPQVQRNTTQAYGSNQPPLQQSTGYMSSHPQNTHTSTLDFQQQQHQQQMQYQHRPGQLSSNQGTIDPTNPTQVAMPHQQHYQTGGQQLQVSSHTQSQPQQYHQTEVQQQQQQQYQQAGGQQQLVAPHTQPQSQQYQHARGQQQQVAPHTQSQYQQAGGQQQQVTPHTQSQPQQYHYQTGRQQQQPQQYNIQPQPPVKPAQSNISQFDPFQ